MKVFYISSKTMRGMHVTAREQDLEMEVREGLSRAMRAALKNSGKTQVQVAAEMPASLRQITRYLQRDTTTPVDFLVRFAEVTNVSFENLIREAGLIPSSDAVDVTRVINDDPQLDARWKEMLIASYRTAVREMSSGKRTMGRRLR